MATRTFQTGNNVNVCNPITTHARKRMSGRSINESEIDLVLNYGRSSHTRKAVIYAIGRREIKEFGRFLEPCEGIHVLCSPHDGAIITTYRNRNLSEMKH